MGAVGNLLRGRRFAAGFALAFALCAAACAFPGLAWADIAGDVNAWLCGVLRDTVNWVFASQVDVLKGIGAGGALGAGFEQMLGRAGSVSMYDVVHGA